ncbi:Hypothetical_protein [Hexamita inflata]|uniref:Hypothetical_protein n=1 Tax=Hexamita inflata TaxID=28002 RepID=A0ABP1GZX3_9EUKA
MKIKYEITERQMQNTYWEFQQYKTYLFNKYKINQIQYTIIEAIAPNVYKELDIQPNDTYILTDIFGKQRVIKFDDLINDKYNIYKWAQVKQADEDLLKIYNTEFKNYRYKVYLKNIGLYSSYTFIALSLYQYFKK